MSLEKIVKELVAQGCPSVQHEGAILILRKLGGLSAVISTSIEEVMAEFVGNPRAGLRLEEARGKLNDRVPLFRARVQAMLSQKRPAQMSDVRY
jgi:hypothetical protein